MRILISAGEASGDMYGALLIEALRRLAGESPATTLNQRLDFFGAGGDRMRAAGCDTVVDSKQLAVVGITEILGHLPKIWGLFHRLIAEADRRKPDLAIVIDSPAFNWRVARQMKKRGIPVVYYVCPQFWAWRQGRVRLLRKYVDKALVIFPFEEKFYRDRGVDATFVGHPLADLPHPEIDRATYAAQYKLDPEKFWITLMPGSRVKEVRRNLPELKISSVVLGSRYELLLPVASTLDRHILEKQIAGFNIHLVSEALPALAHSRAGVIASGTATVEAAIMGTPFVMVYRVSDLTYLLGRPRVKVPYFAMVNLIAENEIVPELVQYKFTAQNIGLELNKILPDGGPRRKMIGRLAQVKARLKGPDSGTVRPADRAAGIVMSMLTKARPAPSPSVT